MVGVFAVEMENEKPSTFCLTRISAHIECAGCFWRVHISNTTVLYTFLSCAGDSAHTEKMAVVSGTHIPPKASSGKSAVVSARPKHTHSQSTPPQKPSKRAAIFVACGR
jgi:hypothetical protein